jgi:hypothetical protein
LDGVEGGAEQGDTGPYFTGIGGQQFMDGTNAEGTGWHDLTPEQQELHTPTGNYSYENWMANNEERSEFNKYADSAFEGGTYQTGGKYVLNHDYRDEGPGPDGTVRTEQWILDPNSEIDNSHQVTGGHYNQASGLGQPYAMPNQDGTYYLVQNQRPMFAGAAITSTGGSGESFKQAFLAKPPQAQLIILNQKDDGGQWFIAGYDPDTSQPIFSKAVFHPTYSSLTAEQVQNEGIPVNAPGDPNDPRGVPHYQVEQPKSANLEALDSAGDQADKLIKEIEAANAASGAAANAVPPKDNSFSDNVDAIGAGVLNPGGGDDGGADAAPEDSQGGDWNPPPDDEDLFLEPLEE